MIQHEEADIYLSQLMAGILLFKNHISGNELLDIISLFSSKLNMYVIEVDSDYDDIYKLIEQSGSGYRLKSYYNYDSLLVINGKKIKLFEYLKNNTTDTIIKFLSDNIFNGCSLQEDNLLLDRHVSFLKEKLFRNSKILKTKSGII